MDTGMDHGMEAGLIQRFIDNRDVGTSPRRTILHTILGLKGVIPSP